MVVLSSTFLVAVLLLGTVLGRSASPDGPYRHLAVYTEVLSRIKSEYVEEPDLKSVTLGALNGLLESIDPFASYLNSDQYKEYQKNRGTLKGEVGLVLAKRYGYIGIVTAVPGSPGARAGLTTGDMLESIRGVATRDMPLAYADLLLHGVPGTTVEISVLRIRRPEPQKLTLTRALLTDPPVAAKMLPNQIGYIRPETLVPANNIRPEALVPSKVKQVAAAIADLEKKGASSLILDLRHNAVGDPEQGVALADLFLDKGKITYLQGQRHARKDFDADPASVWNKKLVVIVNRGTAGAAEVASAGLLANKRAELVGERSYGDAAVRRAVGMEDGGAIILSVAKYYTPEGKAIQDTGVTPPNLVNEPEPRVESEEEEAPAPEPAKPEEDILLKKAIEIASK